MTEQIELGQARQHADMEQRRAEPAAREREADAAEADRFARFAREREAFWITSKAGCELASLRDAMTCAR